MKKTELITKTLVFKADTKAALELLWQNVNKGQRNKILKNPEVAKLFEKYGVDTEVE